jgi:RHH-type proline utilization regulon transcriptional repressor/proline dehydrogenase/delta 1-pyrroline-5-carboxylate dehydrogenase
MGPGKEAASKQAVEARAQGCTAVEIADGCTLDGTISTADLFALTGFDAVAFWGAEDEASDIRDALAARDGVLIPLLMEVGDSARYHIERHMCIDTTASGGNTQLLSSS